MSYRVKCPKCKKIMVDLYEAAYEKNGMIRYLYRSIWICEKHGLFCVKNGYIQIATPKIYHLPVTDKMEWKYEDFEVKVK